MQRLKNISFNGLLFLNCLLLFLLIFETRLTLPAWLQVFGRMHPLIVHFPIVLILVYFACLFFIPKQFKTENWYTGMMEAMLLLSAFTSVFAALMGLFLSKEEGYDP